MNSNNDPSTNKDNVGFHDPEAGVAAGEVGAADVNHTISCSTSASPAAAAPPPPMTTTIMGYKPTQTEGDNMLSTMKRVKLSLLATTILIVCMIVAISLYAALYGR